MRNEEEEKEEERQRERGLSIPLSLSYSRRWPEYLCAHIRCEEIRQSGRQAREGKGGAPKRPGIRGFGSSSSSPFEAINAWRFTATFSSLSFLPVARFLLLQIDDKRPAAQEEEDEEEEEGPSLRSVVVVDARLLRKNKTEGRTDGPNPQHR